MKYVGLSVACVLLPCLASGQDAYDAELYQQAGVALRRAVDKLAAPEIAKGIVNVENMVEAQPDYETERPPVYGQIFARAYEVTHARKYLDYFCLIADFLIEAKQPAGGYARPCYVKQLGSNKTFPKDCSFRNSRDLKAVRIILDAYKWTGERKYLESAIKTADFMLEAQYECGAWPSEYPPRAKGSWLALPMLNDQVTISQTRVLLAVYEVTRAPKYLEGVKKAGQWFIDWQLPEPTPGWAQQYNWDKTPAWGRPFEPPSCCGAPSSHAINLLIDIYLATGDEKYLGPIPAVIAWFERSRTGPNEWARFYEPSTGKPIYAASHDERDIRYNRDVLYAGYAQWGSWSFERHRARWERLQELGREGLIAHEAAPPSVDELRATIAASEPAVRQLISPDGFIGKYLTDGGNVRTLSSAVGTLHRYLKATRMPQTSSQQLQAAGDQPC